MPVVGRYYSVWCMVYGVWCMVYGVWCMVYGVWCMEYNVETHCTFYHIDALHLLSIDALYLIYIDALYLLSSPADRPRYSARTPGSV